MSLKDRLDSTNDKSAYQAPWSLSNSFPTARANATKQSKMHANNAGDPGKGYSLAGNPTQTALPPSSYFVYAVNKTVSIPSPSTIDTNSGVTTTYTTHYPGNGQLGTGRYSQNAPEGQSPGGL